MSYQANPPSFDTEAADRTVDSDKPLLRIAADNLPQQALTDLIQGGSLFHLWGRLAFHDIRQRFRRSALGPIWITISMGVLIGTMGLVFSTLFQQQIDQMLPYIAIGIIFWSFLTGCLNEGMSVFVVAESFIRNVPMPISIHFYRMMARNFFIFLFNMAIYFVLLLAFHIVPGWRVLTFIPGLMLFICNAAWISLVAALISTRYRDIPQIISNAIQVVFYATPVFWSPAAFPGRMAFIELNPFYHLLAIVRSPLLGELPSPESWVICTVMAIVGIGAAILLYRRTYARIPYWV